ncbi:hypothetical protein HWX41_27220 [Bacillus paramycoides]|uniref:hypothetical protein n=1 Tax=Bacillus paramycoides TaxID=2026194 RepID=UPI0015B88B86|nr:hypothetical protein [Bacillus paramycoides]NWK72615.1 hypothetical protein [Bacillus paramycoides]
MNNFTKIIIGLLGISTVCSMYVVFDTKKELDHVQAKVQVQAEEKEKAIKELETKLDHAKKKMAEENKPKTEAEKQAPVNIEKQYKEVTNQFVHAYLDYSVKNKGERRNNLLKMTEQSLVDRIAPNAEDGGDPGFKSKVNETIMFIDNSNDINQKCSVLVDVKYTIEALENGKTDVHNFMKVTLEKKDNAIKVVDVSMYPIK